MQPHSRGRHRLVARLDHWRRRSPARPPDHRGRGQARGVAALVAAGLVVAACGSEPSGPGELSPTFERASGAGLTFGDTVAKVSDVLPPRGEDETWTIVGSVFDPEDRASVAAVWTADEARRWERTTIEPGATGTGELMAAATATDDGLVAVGRVGDGAEADAAVWRLVDGDWEPSRPEAMGGDHEQWAVDVAAGPGGLLVAGGESVWGEVRPRLWHSADGETWTTVDGGAGGPLDETGEETLRDIVAVGDGFVAVGSRTLDNQQDGVVWYSPDGQSWERVEAPTIAGPGRQELLTVTATDGVVVAGGYTEGDGGRGVPVVWRSPDGRTWEPASAPLPVTDRRSTADDLAVRSLSVGDQGLVAAGGDNWVPRVWRSPDGGARWDELANPIHGELFEDGVDLVDAEAAGGLTVALGSEPAVLLLAGARWEDATGDAFPRGGDKPFALGVAAGAETTIVGGGLATPASGDARESRRGQVWQLDGDRWAPVETATLGMGHMMDVTPFAGGFAAVGFEDFGVAESRELVKDPEPDALVWVSRDGKDWARIGVQNAEISTDWLEFLENPSPEQAPVIAALEAEAAPMSAEPAGGDGTRSLAAVAPLGDGFIAVGSAYDGVGGQVDPIVIVSDGVGYTGEEPVATGPGDQVYNDVCVAPDGAALAVGDSGTRGATDVIAGRRAPEGGWAPATGPESFAGDGSQHAYGCAAGDDGYIIVGADDRTGNVDARVWVSDDGLTFTEVESSLLGGSGDQWAAAVVAATEGGWLVAGTDTASGDGAGDVALWRITADGEVARRDRGEPALGGPGEQRVTNLTVDEDGRVTIVGTDYGRVGLWQSDTIDR